MLLSTNPQQGDKIEWPIGNRAEGTFDRHPGILIRLGHGIDDRDREGLVATVVLQRTRLDGTTYLSAQKILEQFIDDRYSTVVGLDATTDGEVLTVADVMKALGDQRADFFVNGPVDAGSPVTADETIAVGASDLPV